MVYSVCKVVIMSRGDVGGSQMVSPVAEMVDVSALVVLSPSDLSVKKYRVSLIQLTICIK